MHRCLCILTSRHCRYSDMAYVLSVPQFYGTLFPTGSTVDTSGILYTYNSSFPRTYFVHFVTRSLLRKLTYVAILYCNAV